MLFNIIEYKFAIAAPSTIYRVKYSYQPPYTCHVKIYFSFGVFICMMFVFVYSVVCTGIVYVYYL